MCAAVKINRIGKFDLNPRGNLWLKDENRFGHKLLAKMGWSQGKGLGKNEDGVSENLKVRMKSDNTGVGWTEEMPFSVECDAYETVLANLNEKFKSTKNETKKENHGKSLELRAQQFKNRLHYGKFVRGKDVCHYSEKDMNCIFVTKNNKSEPTVAPEKTSVTNVESCPTEDDSQKSMPMYKSQMSVNEYFEMKMKKKSGMLQKPSLDVKEIESDEPVSMKDVPSKKRKKTSDRSEKSKRRRFEEAECLDESDADVLIKTEPIDEMLEVAPCVGESPQVSFSSNRMENVEQPCPVASEVSKKKRKKALKNREKLKKTKLAVQDVLEESSASTDSREKDPQNDTILEDESSPPDVEVLLEKQPKLKSKKSKKDKSGKLRSTLKTCLKGSSKYSLPKEDKSVSFNECVFYRQLNTEEGNAENESEFTETSESIIYGDETLNMDEFTTNETSDSNMNSELYSGESTDCNNPQKAVFDEFPDVEDDFSDMPNCMNLPKCDKSNYNSWLENQRLATKMKLYKNMIKRIKKHPILRTSNILDIKGYGNWGL